MLQTSKRFCLPCSKLSSSASMVPKIQRRPQLKKMKMRQLGRQLFDNKARWLTFKFILFKQEVLQTLLYGRTAWNLKVSDVTQLSMYHRLCLHRLTGFRKCRLNDTGKRLISYKHLLRVTGCECIEALILRRRLTYAGHVLRLGDDRSPNVLLLGEIKSPNASRKARENRGPPATTT